MATGLKGSVRSLLNDGAGRLTARSGLGVAQRLNPPRVVPLHALELGRREQRELRCMGLPRFQLRSTFLFLFLFFLRRFRTGRSLEGFTSQGCYVTWCAFLGESGSFLDLVRV